MARHSLEPRVCKRVSSSTYSRHYLSDSSNRCLTSTVMSNKPWESSPVVSRAWRAFASSPLRRAILRERSYASPQAEASAVQLSASTLDTRS
jgi:hypothetical protein